MPLSSPSFLSDVSQAATFDIVPTVGYSVERFQKDKLAFEVFDMSGQVR